MLVPLLLVQETAFPYEVELDTAGRVLRIGRAQFTTTVNAETERITTVYRYQSLKQDVFARREEVHDRDGRLISSMTGQRLYGESEEVVRLEKRGGKWKLTSQGEPLKDDFPVTITDSSILWWRFVKPDQDMKVKTLRFNGENRVDSLTAIYHGPDEVGLKVERWRPGFNEKTWYSESGRVLRMEVSEPGDETVMVYRLAED